jgi:hypothetical protein
MHYLRASEMEIGLLINFGPDARFRRIMMQNERKKRLSADVFQVAAGVGR